MSSRRVAGIVLMLAILFQERLLFAQTIANPAPGLDLSVPRTGFSSETYRLLINVTMEPSGGMRVASVSPNSPTKHMVRDDDRSQVGNLEPGDVIIHINETPIGSIDGYYETIKASNGDVKLTIIDKNTGKPINWNVRAVKVKDPSDGKDDSAAHNGTAHVLLIGLTKDANIGELVAEDLKMLESVFRNSLDSSRLDLRIVKDDDCNARFIIQSVQEMGARSHAEDAILVYYDGHGAYDPRYAPGDPSAGHFFQIPPPKSSPPGEGGDLLRKTLSDNILAQPGRLKVLISDACNVRATARPAKRFQYEDRDVTVRGPTNFEQLFFYHRGYLDANSASHDQSSWGNFFCSSFTELIPQYSEWPALMKELSTKSNGAYADWRLKQLATPISNPNILRQTEMKPAVFRIQLNKDKLPVSGPTRVVRQTFLKLVPTETE